MVRRIHVDPNPCNPHAPHTKNPIHPKQRLIPSNEPNRNGHHHPNPNPIHRHRQRNRPPQPKWHLLPIPRRSSYNIHGPCPSDEGDICEESWGVVVELKDVVENNRNIKTRDFCLWFFGVLITNLVLSYILEDFY